MSHIGDRAVASTVYFNFTTAVNGVPTTLSGTPAVSVYKNSTTQSTTGVTLTADYDGVTGLNHVAVDTSADGTFYAAGNHFDVVVTTGTVGGSSVVGHVVGSFTLQVPAAADVRNIAGSAVNTSSAQLGVNVVNAAGTAWGSGAITAASIATDAITAAKIAADAIGASELAADAVTEIQSGLATASALSTVAGYVDTEVAAIKAKTDSLTFTAAGLLDANVYRWNGTAVAAPTLAGVPKVEVSTFADTGVNDRLARILADTDTGLKDEIATLDTGFRAILNTTGVLVRASNDTGLNDNLYRIRADVDTGLRDTLADYDTGMRALVAAGVVTTVAAIPAANAVADALLDRADAVEVGLTPRQSLRLLAAVLAGKVSGAGTGTEVFRNAVADSKPRITATVDSSGNRTGIATDVT